MMIVRSETEEIADLVAGYAYSKHVAALYCFRPEHGWELVGTFHRSGVTPEGTLLVRFYNYPFGGTFPVASRQELYACMPVLQEGGHFLGVYTPCLAPGVRVPRLLVRTRTDEKWRVVAEYPGLPANGDEAAVTTCLQRTRDFSDRAWDVLVSV